MTLAAAVASRPDSVTNSTVGSDARRARKVSDIAAIELRFIPKGDEEHQRCVTPDPCDVTHHVPRRRGRPVQVLDHEQRRVHTGRLQQVLVHSGLHGNTVALRVDDEVSTDPGSAFDGEQGGERLVRPLPAVGAAPQGDSTSALVHRRSDGSGEPRLADPGLATDDGDDCSVSRPLPAGQQPMQLLVATDAHSSAGDRLELVRELIAPRRHRSSRSAATCQVDAVVDPELAQQRRHVALDSALGHPKPSRDLRVRQPLCQGVEHLGLTPGNTRSAEDVAGGLVHAASVADHSSESIRARHGSTTPKLATGPVNALVRADRTRLGRRVRASSYCGRRGPVPMVAP